MKKIFLLFFSLLCISTMQAQLPSIKVDVSATGRTNLDEILEPGYTWWNFKKDVKSDEIEVDGIKCTICIDENAEYLLRGGWSKAFVQDATAKAKNGRLTGDGANIDPDMCGSMTLRLEGLPKGTHTLQTYHNGWSDPATSCGWPMTIKCNGKVVHENVMRTFQEAVAANATLVTTVFTIENDGDIVELEISTSEDNPGHPTAAQTRLNKTPLINAFELNTVSIASQAKNPKPLSGDVHVDADNHEYTLSWSPANDKVKEHRLYFGTDSIAVANMTVPVAIKEYKDTTYHVSDLYSMDTYWWRVDEVDSDGNVTEGNAWYFRPRQLAFPGAEGYGRYATGGRGGQVYHVTNLKNDHNPGSLLYGLKDLVGPRTIVFDVSGIIDMDFQAIFADDYITLAPQTAPGKGICLRHSNLNMGDESIIRFLRARRGNGDTGNAMGQSGNNYTIVDHISALWGTDETYSSRTAKMMTFQYSMIAEALGIADHKNYASGTNHGYAATIGGDIATFSHNFLVDCHGRNWSLGGGLDGDGYYSGRLDIFNNVVYNYGSRATDGGAHEVNFVGNYYKQGPAGGTSTILNAQLEGVGKGTQSYYVKGNVRQAANNGSITQDKLGSTYKYTLSGGQVLDWNVWATEPFFPSYATIHKAEDAYKIVVSDAGATMPCRDEQHKRMQTETINASYTYTGSRSGIKGQIDDEADCGGFEAFPEDVRPNDFDTDQDGMPNWWEEITGSNPLVADNNEDPDHDGWTLLENYLEFMSHPYVVVDPAGTETVDMAEHFRGFTKSPSYTIATDSENITASISGSKVTVSGKGAPGVGTVKVTVTDSEGTSFTQLLGVAVSGSTDGIQRIWDESKINIAKREYFTLDGKKVSKLNPQDVYIMRITDTDGNIHTTKVIR